MTLSKQYIQSYIEWRTVTAKPDDYSKPDNLVELGHELLMNGYMPLDIKRLNQQADQKIVEYRLIDRVKLFYQTTERINAAIEKEENRQYWEMWGAQQAYQMWLDEQSVLRMQRNYYNADPSESRRFFIFWYGDGSTCRDRQYAETLNRLCEAGLFSQTDKEYGIYRITDKGLKMENES